MIKILFGSVLFVILYNLLFYPTVVGMGLGVFFAILNAYLFFVRTKQPGNLPLAVGSSLLAVLFATAIGWRANGMVQELDFLIAVFFTVVSAYFYKKEKTFRWDIISFLAVPLAAGGEFLASSLQFIFDHHGATLTSRHKAIFVPIVRGIVIAIPIVVILFKLLSGADPIFATLFGTLTFTPSWQLIISLSLFTVAFFWGITAVKDRFHLHAIPPEAIQEKESLSIEALIVSLGTAILFGLFLYVQFQYLFLEVPETQLQHLGINIATYSEYVRQGFFQLLIAAGIATSIVAFGARTIHAIENKFKLLLQGSMVILTLETELLLLSAAKRLSLYAGAHGLTISRILGIIFLVWLSAVLIILMYSLVKRIKRLYFFIAIFAITTGALVSVNVVPIDSIVAKSYPPTVNGQIDYIYIANLSSDARDAWPSIIKYAQNEWQNLAKIDSPTVEQERQVVSIRLVLSRLERTVFLLDTYPLIKWQAFNYSEYQARRLIQANRPLFDQIKVLREGIRKKEQKWADAQIKRDQQNQYKR